jgi:hypothetical protein
MRKRVHIALAVLLVMLAGVSAWLGLREREPVYQEKRLSFWLENLHRERMARRQDERDVEAIRQIGTNALPVLIKRLHAQDTRLKQLIMTWAKKQRLVHFHFKSADERRYEAVCGYEALGPLAVVQVQSLSDTLTSTPSPGVRQAAAWALGYIGPEATRSAPALFRATKDTNDFVRGLAFEALGRVRPDPHATIPVLVAGLADPIGAVRSSAAGALSGYGQEARLAAPALFRATQDTESGVRMSAFWALSDIRPDPRLSIPILVTGLDDPFWPARAVVARALQNYGPDAKAAVPALIKMVGAYHSAGIERDPFSDALKAIDPEAAAKAGVK